MVMKLGYELDIFKKYRFLDHSEMQKIFSGASCVGDCRHGCERSCEDSCTTCKSSCSNGPDSLG
jgi:hypothetical protein